MSNACGAAEEITGEPTAVEPIAVVGMACRVPGASTVEQYWRNMREGVESISRFTVEELLTAGVPLDVVRDPDYVRAAGIVEDADMFDAAFFGFNPREAETMDPQQRIFCEVAWEALEHSGHDPKGVPGHVGVFAGSFMNKYLTANLATNPRFARSPMAPLARIFNDKDFLATRVSYLLGLTGPAYAVQTACSTSLVAVHLACQSLLGYECDVALAGGVAVNVPLKSGYPVADGGLFSPDGHCRPFDAGARGTVPGNGAVVLVLRRLSDALADADHVYAVIRATAVNNDGALKAGFTAPSVDGQAAVIAAAQALAGIDPISVGYLEAHGTATAVGDPIEIAALTQAFRALTAERGYCALGSAKANIGHLDAAAGAAGLLRAVLALDRHQIPPSINFSSPNPGLTLAQTPFYVPTSAIEWKRSRLPRRAGVSSFGVGGTNAHAVLEEAPEPSPSGPSRPWQLLTVSARSRAAVDASTTRLAEHLQRVPNLKLADVAFTLQEGRHDFDVRRFAVCSDVEDAALVLGGHAPRRLVTRRTAPGTRQVLYMFPGGGHQYSDMGVDIYRSEPVFRAAVDDCARLLEPQLGFDLRGLMFPSESPVAATVSDRVGEQAIGRGRGPGVVSALFVTEYALARLWMSWGIEPRAMIGQSLGECVAACLAGVFTLPDALMLTVRRGELFARMPPGAMLVAPLPEQQMRRLIDERVWVSAVNAPALTAVTGQEADIVALADRLRAAGTPCRRINVPVASHSALVEPYLEGFVRAVQACTLHEPRIPIVSCVTGTWLRPGEATDPGYWGRHLRQEVRFSDGLREALAQPDQVLLEVGPGSALTSLAAAQHLAPAPVAVASMRPADDPRPDRAHLLSAVGRLWQAGVRIDWKALHGQARPHRVALPTYPFERSRFWVQPGRPAGAASGGRPVGPEETGDTSDTGGGPDTAAVGDTGGGRDSDGYLPPRTPREAQIARIWCDLLGVDRVGVDEDFFDLGAHSLMVTQLTRELRRLGAEHLTARAVFTAPTVADLAALVDGGSAGSVSAGLDLAGEVVLDPTIRADGLPGASTEPPKIVLLTGATGFVGSFLCAELARQTRAQVLCLVRAASAEEGQDRLRAALAAYGLTGPWLVRVKALPGDLSQPLLGIGAERFDDLAARVDAVYHCGAWVNFVRPYRALKATNVCGTQEILRLATTSRLKPVHHISTLAVLAGAVAAGVSEIREDDPLPPPVGHDTAYSQSKWVAEGLIELARDRGVPVSVYRAGAVLSDSRTGATNPEDYVTKVIVGCVDLGAAPRRDYPLSVGSVDHFTRLVTALSLQPETVGTTFHAIDPCPLPWNLIFDRIRDFGYPVRSVPWDQWRRELTDRVDDDEKNALAPLMAMLGDTADRRMPRIDCGNVLAALSAAQAAPPALDSGFFDRMLGFFVRNGLLPAVAHDRRTHN